MTFNIGFLLIYFSLFVPSFALFLFLLQQTVPQPRNHSITLKKLQASQ